MMDAYWSAFNAASDPNQGRDRANLAQLQQLQGLTTIADHLQTQAKARRASELEAQFRADIQGATTPEARLAVAQKYMGADSLGKSIQGSQDKAVHEAGVRENARGRLAQALQLADVAHQDRMRNATTAEGRAAETARHNFMVEAIQRDAVTNTGARLAYETGATPANSAATLAGSEPPKVNSGGRVAETQAPDEATAITRMWRSGGGGEQGNIGGKQFNIEIPSDSPSSQMVPSTNLVSPTIAALRGGSALPSAAQPSAPNAWSPPVAAAPIASPAVPDAANLDANDLRARAAAAFQASKTPIAPVVMGAPPVAPVAVIPKVLSLADAPAGMAPAMKQKWLFDQTKAKPAAVGTLNAEELGPMAWEKLLFGTNPPGMGNASAAQRQQVNAERARLGRSLGLSDMEMAMLPQDNKVKMKAVDTLTKWGATVGRSAEKLDLDLGVALDYAKKLPLTTIQMVNRGVVAGMKEFNDPNANAYATAINSVRQEYARLMSGPTSNAMLPVEAMKKGNELLSSGVDVPSLEEVGKQMRRDAANTMTATNSGINALRGSITSLGKTGAFERPQDGQTQDRRSEPRTEKRVVITY